MNKENNRSAAGLRRSAVVERIRLREEWSALKGPEASGRPQAGVLAKRNGNIAQNILKKQINQKTASNGFEMKDRNKENTRGKHLTCDALRGVVALVEVGTETRALALRAALSALGASVVPTWSPLVTHLVWAQGGCRSTRARGLALACRLVSPLWVEACAGAGRRLPEGAFPAAARASDLPSPRTLRRLLKQAEMENISLFDLLNDSKEDKQRPMRLRISSETEDKTTDTSHDTSADTSRDTTTGIESRVNTAPRRALPLSLSVSPAPARAPRRKLFTHKEGQMDGQTSDESDTDVRPKRSPSKLTQRERRDLARAERMAKKLVAACTQRSANNNNNIIQANLKPRIVLTGMGRSERQEVTSAVQALGGKLQSHVNRRTTHVLLGSCQEKSETTTNGMNVCSNITGITNHSPDQLVVHRSDIIKARTLNALSGAVRGCRVLNSQWAIHSAQHDKWLHHHGYEVQHLRKIAQKARVERTALGKLRSEYSYDIFNGMRVLISPNAEQKDAATQLLNLCGAITQNGGQPRNGGLTQNGGQPRNGGLTQNGGQTRNGALTQNGGQPRNGALTQNGGQTRNGALTQNGGQPRNGVLTQNGGDRSADFDITIGTGEGEISSKWVFDSVASGRMRTTRRYINTSIPDSGQLFSSLRTDR